MLLNKCRKPVSAGILNSHIHTFVIFGSFNLKSYSQFFLRGFQSENISFIFCEKHLSIQPVTVCISLYELENYIQGFMLIFFKISNISARKFHKLYKYCKNVFLKFEKYCPVIFSFTLHKKNYLFYGITLPSGTPVNNCKI